MELVAYVAKLRNRFLLVRCEMVVQEACAFALEMRIPRMRF